MSKKLRLYSFCNMYLGGIQAGIQAAHAVTDLLVDHPPEVYEFVKEWCEEPTMILLNGGYQSSLEQIFEGFVDSENEYPWGSFRESEEALNGALTNVCIILPEKIYMYDKWVKLEDNIGHAGDREIAVYTSKDGEYTDYFYSIYEMKIVETLRGKRLMS